MDSSDFKIKMKKNLQMTDNLTLEREFNSLIEVTLRLECELDYAVKNSGNLD